MYAEWKKDPTSVHPSWNAYFHNIDSGYSPASSYTAPPTLGRRVINLRNATSAIAFSATSSGHVDNSGGTCIISEGRYVTRAGSDRGGENIVDGAVVLGVWT